MSRTACWTFARFHPSKTLLLIGAAVLTGCVSGPTNNEQTSGYTTFTGYTWGAHDKINVRVRNLPWKTVRVPVWNTMTSGYSDTSGLVDCDHITWYGISINSPSLSARPYNDFMLSPNPGYNKIKLKLDDEDLGLDLATFESDAYTCQGQYCGGMAKRDNCASPESPVLTLETPCGNSLWGSCCHLYDTCSAPYECSPAGACQPNSWAIASDYHAIATDWPDDYDGDWTDEFQGWATDGSYWYFVQNIIPPTLRKVPLNVNWEGSMGGYPHTSINFGCDHWGDPDVSDGVVYVPLEGCGGDKHQEIAAFRASDLWSYPSDMTRIATSSAPWVAVNPTNHKLYLSEFANNHDAQSPPASCLYVYDAAIVNGNFSVTPAAVEGGTGESANCIPMVKSNGTPASLYRVQGGAFSGSGKLYLTSDSYAGSNESAYGIQAFNVSPRVATWKFRVNVPVSHDSHQEVEGIAAFDWGSWGKLHVMVLDNDGLGTDNLFGQHYTVNGNW